MFQQQRDKASIEILEHTQIDAMHSAPSYIAWRKCRSVEERMWVPVSNAYLFSMFVKMFFHIFDLNSKPETVNNSICSAPSWECSSKSGPTKAP